MAFLFVLKETMSDTSLRLGGWSGTDAPLARRPRTIRMCSVMRAVGSTCTRSPAYVVNESYTERRELLCRQMEGCASYTNQRRQGED